MKANLSKLNRLNDQQLIKAYNALNNYNWPKALGDKPFLWDRLPKYPPLRKSLLTAILYHKTKLDIAAPYLDQIAMIMGHRLLKKENEGTILFEAQVDVAPAPLSPRNNVVQSTPAAQSREPSGIDNADTKVDQYNCPPANLAFNTNWSFRD